MSGEAERFWARVDKTDTCWNWTGELNNKGYGRFSTYSKDDRRRHLAHRYAARLSGIPVEGVVLLHTCDNPRCVNPSHLQPGTQGDNIRDAIAKGRLNMSGLELGRQMSKRGRIRTGNLPPDELKARLVELNTAGWTDKRIAAEFEMNVTSVFNLRHALGLPAVSRGGRPRKKAA